MRLHFGYIIGFFALLLAASAGYISVVGWGKLFAGEATIVMIIMGVIESAKIIATIYLHRYGKSVPKPKGVNAFSYFFKSIFSLKTYLVIGVVATMMLTSVGIYGFLTGAYQDTANKMELHDGEIGILQGKRDIFQQKIEGNKDIIENKNKRSNQLSDLRTQQEARLQQLIIDEHWSNARKTRQEIAAANKEIQKLTEDIDVVTQKNSELADSVSVYQVQILELNGSSDVAAEIGPLKYVAALTGRPMGSIINWIVLIIIFIFDPMAISFVIAANKVFEKNAKKDDGHPPIVDDEGDDKPKKPIVDPETGIINLPKEPLPIEEDFYFTNNGESADIETLPDEIIEDIIEPEPSGTTNEIIHEDDINEEVLYDDIEEPIDDDIPEEEIIEDEVIEEVVDDIIKQPEAQIEENKQKIKETSSFINKIKDKISKKPKLEPVVVTGNVKREEIKEIKEGTRGYSVNVPEPKKVGTNKEVREGEPKTFFFKRPKT